MLRYTKTKSATAPHAQIDTPRKFVEKIESFMGVARTIDIA
jgi:hypothetical protein